MLAKFDNTIRGTFKNSIYMAILSLPKTVLMMLCWVIPVVLAIYVYQLFPVVIMLGVSGPAFLNALFYSKTYKKFEPQEEAPVSDEEWTVAADEEGIGADECEAQGAEIQSVDEEHCDE